MFTLLWLISAELAGHILLVVWVGARLCRIWGGAGTLKSRGKMDVRGRRFDSCQTHCLGQKGRCGQVKGGQAWFNWFVLLTYIWELLVHQLISSWPSTQRPAVELEVSVVMMHYMEAWRVPWFVSCNRVLSQLPASQLLLAASCGGCTRCHRGSRGMAQ